MNNFFHAAKQEGLSVTDEELSDTCFHFYDRDDDGGLNLKEFGSLCRDLLADANGRSYNLQIRMQADMFYVFDANKDGKIDEAEFKFMWNRWIKTVINPITALIVVDVQNDFVSGSLALHRCPAGQRGEEVVPVINGMAETIPFDTVVYTLDWHPANHVSFIENVHDRPLDPSINMSPEEVQVYDTVVFEGPPKVEQKLWPTHCVQDSWGSQLHPDLKLVEDCIFVRKGSNSEIDSYSAFWDNQKLSATNLDTELKSRGVTDVFVCGLATDFCVAFTALHALENGYRTYLVEDASRGITHEDIATAKKKLTSQNALILDSPDVKDIAEGKDRRLELGYRSAMLLAANSRD